MKKVKAINKIFTRLTLITNKLNSLRRFFSKVEKMKKVLRCLSQ